MGLRKTYTFQDCPSEILEVRNPQTGELEGYVLVIIDTSSGDAYRYPMPLETARLHGQKMMGIGRVEVPQGNEAAAIANAARGG